MQVNEREALWRIDVALMFTWCLAVLLFALGCCPIRAAEVGVLTGFGIYTPQQRNAAMDEINRECSPPPEKIESRASLKCWYVSPGGSLECEKP